MRYEKKVTWLVSAPRGAPAHMGGGPRLLARARGRPLRVRPSHRRQIGGRRLHVPLRRLARPRPFELIKSGAAWTMTDSSTQLPAQSSRVTASSTISPPSRGCARSPAPRTPGPGFQLDDAQAKRATLKDASGKVLADIYVGSYGPTGSRGLPQAHGLGQLLYGRRLIASYFDYGRPTWLDLEVLGGIKETEVQSFSVKAAIALDGKGKPALALDYGVSRDGKGWKSGAAQLDADSVDSYLRAILGLQGEDYVAAPPAEAFAKIDAKLTLELGSGVSKVLQIGASAGNDRFYGRIGDQGLAFTISNYSLKAALKSLADLSAKK